MYNLKYLRETHLDVTILQSKTVINIKEILERALQSDSKTELRAVATFIIKRTTEANQTADSRKGAKIQNRLKLEKERMENDYNLESLLESLKWNKDTEQFEEDK